MDILIDRGDIKTVVIIRDIIIQTLQVAGGLQHIKHHNLSGIAIRTADFKFGRPANTEQRVLAGVFQNFVHVRAQVLPESNRDRPNFGTGSGQWLCANHETALRATICVAAAAACRSRRQLRNGRRRKSERIKRNTER